MHLWRLENVVHDNQKIVHFWHPAHQHADVSALTVTSPMPVKTVDVMTEPSGGAEAIVNGKSAGEKKLCVLPGK